MSLSKKNNIVFIRQEQERRRESIRGSEKGGMKGVERRDGASGAGDEVSGKEGWSEWKRVGLKVV